MNEVPVYMNVPERTQYDTLKEELFLRVLSQPNKVSAGERDTGTVPPVPCSAGTEGLSPASRPGFSEMLTVDDAKNASVLCGKLAQLANGAVYADDGTVAHIHNRKLDALEDLIESANGNPLLIAYWFQHDIARIRERFPQVRLLKTAEDMQDWNTGKIPIAAIHPASAGHGLNLQAGGNQLVWFGLTWSLVVRSDLVSGTVSADQREIVAPRPESGNRGDPPYHCCGHHR